MKIRQFDVVKLKDKRTAIIKKIINRSKYLGQIMTKNKNEIQQEVIANKDIEKTIYSKLRERWMNWY